MTIRRLLWHPICLAIVLVCSYWELFQAPPRATLQDAACAVIFLVWLTGAAVVYQRGGAL